MNLDWPHTQDPTKTWTCRVCSAVVGTMEIKGSHPTRYCPESKYWNLARGEVYCSAQHSLDRYEELK